MDLTRQGYYYHPLGNLAKELIDNVNDRQFPYVIDGNNDIKPSGVGNIEFGTGPKIPGGVEVYAMATGAIYNIAVDETGFSIYLRTTKQDISGEIICIKYSCLGGLSDDIANAIGAPTGILKQEELKNLTLNSVISLQVTAGQMIGYSNDWDEQKMLKIGFIYRHTTDNEDTDASKFINDLPHLDTEKVKNENITFEAINDENSIAKYVVKCKDEIVGTNNGMCRLESGQSSIYYPVYPFLSYTILQQKPVYCSGVGPSGGISMPNISEVIDGSNMNKNALNCYLTETMSEKWMGVCPNTIEELNTNTKGLRYAVAICKRELNFSQYGDFPGVSYAKLLRAKMIGENKPGIDMKEWFEQLHPSQFDGKSIWISMKFQQEDLDYAKLVYMNLRYPSLYGIETFSGTEEFKNAIVFGCQQVPIYNLSPVQYGPHAFVVNFNISKNKDVGPSGGAGNYLLYRQKSGDMSYFNNKVVEN